MLSSPPLGTATNGSASDFLCKARSGTLQSCRYVHVVWRRRRIETGIPFVGHVVHRAALPQRNRSGGRRAPKEPDRGGGFVQQWPRIHVRDQRDEQNRRCRGKHW